MPDDARTREVSGDRPPEPGPDRRRGGQEAFPSPAGRASFALRLNRTVAGLDVGTASIKLIEVRRTRRGPVATAFGMTATPPQAIIEGLIVKPREVAGAIRTLMTATGVKHRRVVAAVDGQRVILRQVEFPRMKERELRQVLHWETERYIPVNQHETISDFAVLDSPGSAGEAGRMKVLLVETQERIVHGLLETLRAAGLQPEAIDVEALAQFRVLTANGYVPREPRHLSTVVVDLGAAAAKLCVFLDGVPELNRTIPVGGSALTAAIAEGLDQDPMDSEQAKREMGVLPGTPAFPFLKPLLDELLLEVARSIDSYLARSSGQVREVYLAGGGANLKGLPQALADYVARRAGRAAELTIVPVQPLRTVELAPGLREQRSCCGPEFAGALGLALR